MRKFLLALITGSFVSAQAEFSYKIGSTLEKDFITNDVHDNTYGVFTVGMDAIKGKGAFGFQGDVYTHSVRPVQGSLRVFGGWDVFRVSAGYSTGIKSMDEVKTLIDLEEAEVVVGAELNIPAGFIGKSKKNKAYFVAAYDYYFGAKPYRYTNGITAGLKLKFN